MAQKEQAEGWFREFAEMSLDEVAVKAGANSSQHAKAAEIEIERRVAVAQINAANAQKDAANAQRITAWGTLGLIIATLVVALVTYFTIG